jgi:hypothetical protein
MRSGKSPEYQRPTNALMIENLKKTLEEGKVEDVKHAEFTK